MLNSLHSLLLMINSEEVEDFEQAFQMSCKHRDLVNVPQDVRTPSFLDYECAELYYKYLKRCKDLFDDAKVVFFEDFLLPLLP